MYIKHVSNKRPYKHNPAVGPLMIDFILVEIPISAPYLLTSLPFTCKFTCDIRNVLTRLNKPHKI